MDSGKVLKLHIKENRQILKNMDMKLGIRILNYLRSIKNII